MDDAIGSTLDPENRSRLLARAAVCFEFASLPRPAARTYSDAARLLSQAGLRPQAAGELFNRSAHQHFRANEFFFAGSSWRSAAAEFHKLGRTVIRSIDSIPPVPVSAAGDTVAGECFNFAGHAFLKAHGNEAWACGAYWEAGKVYADTFPSPNIQTFNAYRNALNSTIRFYRTLDLDPLRNSLPLTKDERSAKINPIKIMEDAAYRCNFHHQPRMPDTQRASIAQLQTDRQLAATFHEFSILFLEIGNAREAGFFRVAERERQRRIYFAEKRFSKAFLYWFWALTAGYGESLFRWSFACVVAVLAFAFLFRVSNSIDPANGWFDYVYYSIVTFTSLGAGDIQPHGIFGKVLVCGEIGVGLLMFGVLLSFIGNLLNR